MPPLLSVLRFRPPQQIQCIDLCARQLRLKGMPLPIWMQCSICGRVPMPQNAGQETARLYRRSAVEIQSVMLLEVSFQSVRMLAEQSDERQEFGAAFSMMVLSASDMTETLTRPVFGSR